MHHLGVAQKIMRTIESERLLLRPISRLDASEIIRIHSVPEVSRYQSWVPTSEEEIGILIDRMTSDEFLAPDRWFQFSIITKDGSQFIGDCGVHAGANDRRQVEIGITLDPTYQT